MQQENNAPPLKRTEEQNAAKRILLALKNEPTYSQNLPPHTSDIQRRPLR